MCDYRARALIAHTFPLISSDTNRQWIGNPMSLTRIPNVPYPYDKTRISVLDPLGADEIYRQMPAMNAVADVPALARSLRELVPTMALVTEYSLEEALGAMRDLGLFLGSLKRHGVQPVEAVPEVEAILIELGRRTDMIPRETVHHYTEWNPVDDRQRMYTGDPQERFLMDGARTALPHLGDAVELCKKLIELEPDDAEFGEVVTALTERISSFDEAISMVVSKVSPEFFARGMRPYYEEITVGGRTYLGPAAAHVPLFLVDIVVWASDHGHEVYDEFIVDASQHTLPQWRSLVPGWRQRPSLVTKVAAAVRAAPVGASSAVRDATRALYGALRALMLFRGKHLSIARKAYQEEVRLYDLGSGGAPIELLRRILELTKDNSTAISAMYAERRPVAQREDSADGQ